MDLSTATSTTRSDLDAAVAAAASAGAEAGLAADTFAVEERTDPCFAEMGGLERRGAGRESRPSPTPATARDWHRSSAPSPPTWESRGYTVEQARAAGGPGAAAVRDGVRRAQGVAALRRAQGRPAVAAAHRGQLAVRRARRLSRKTCVVCYSMMTLKQPTGWRNPETWRWIARVLASDRVGTSTSSTRKRWRRSRPRP